MAKKKNSGNPGCGCLWVGLFALVVQVLAGEVAGTPGVVGVLALVVLVAIGFSNDPKAKEERLLKEAAKIKADAKYRRDVETAREIVAAHQHGAFDLGQLSQGRYPSDWGSIRQSALTRDGYRCGNCGANGPDTPLHVHHIVPLSRGGVNQLSNLRALCNVCHQRIHS